MNFFVVPVQIILIAFFNKNKVLYLFNPKYNGSQWVNEILSVDFLIPYFINAFNESKSKVA